MRNPLADDGWIRAEIRRYASQKFASYADDKYSAWLTDEGRLVNENVQQDGVDVDGEKTLDNMNDESLEQERARLETWFQKWREHWSLLLIPTLCYRWKELKTRKKRWSRYEPWKVGSQTILTRLNQSVQKYRQKYYSNDEDAWQNANLQHDSLLYLRLFYSWLYFNEQFDEDADSTLERLERSELSKTTTAFSNGQDEMEKANEKRRNFNPLEDLTLLDAMTTEWKRGETRAKERFEQQYGRYYVTVALNKEWIQRAPKNLNDDDEWLNVYYDLVGLSGSKPLAYNYSGEGPLTSWLARVVTTYFFKLNKLKKAKDGETKYESHRLKTIDETTRDVENDSKSSVDIPAGAPSPEFILALGEIRNALEALWERFTPVERVVVLHLITKYKRDVKKLVDKYDASKKSDDTDANTQISIDEDEQELSKILGRYQPKNKKPVCERLFVALGRVLEKTKTSEEYDLLGKTLANEIEDLVDRFPLSENDFRVRLRPI